MNLKGRIAAIAVALAPFYAGATTYAYIVIKYDGAIATDTRGINNKTTVVGYADFPDGSTVSFYYLDGNLTPLPPAPGGVALLAGAINDYGIVAGDYIDPSDLGGGFTYNGTSYTLVPTPPQWIGIDFRGINNAGYIAGLAGQASGIGLGFIYDSVNGTFNVLSDPTPSTNVFANSVFTFAHGINNAGQVNGSVQIPSFITGHPGRNWAYLRNPDGSATKFRVVNDDTPTRGRGINDNGVMAGSADIFDPVTSTVTTKSWVGTSAGYEILMVPDSVATFAENINNLGQVSGLFFDSTESIWGFYATPVSVPTGTTSSGAYTFSVDVVPDTPIFIDPQVALGFEYAIGTTGPKFAATRPPIGYGDNKYTILVNGKAFDVFAGELFDFRTHGYPDGVAKFRITGIEDDVALDPLNALAFPTQVAFMDAGRFTGTMTPLCLRGPIPANAARARIRALGSCTK